MISLSNAADFLLKSEDVAILSHQFPDGDTLGSAAALCRGLHKLGKRARVFCSDPITEKYAYLFEGLKQQEFEPKTIVAVDVADEKLLGEPLLSQFGGRVQLCIDHHASNSSYARQCYVDKTAAATTEIIFELLSLLQAPVDSVMADCIYTGITTDTGCFKYTNATPRSYRIAAEMMERGAQAAQINRVMFDTKTRQRMEMERLVMDSISYYFGGRCAVITITQDMIRLSGAMQDDLEGLASIPRQIEGVLIGITIREKEDGEFKISLRTQPPMDASAICERFGGGGHKGAAGCTLAAPLAGAKTEIVGAVGEYLKRAAIY